jgi:hypothetical protein
MRRALCLPLCLLLFLLVGCSVPVRITTLPQVAGAPVRKLALLPLRAAPGMSRGADGPAQEKYSTSIVTARVQEALIEIGGFDIVPQAEVAMIVGTELAAETPPDPLPIAQRLREAFGIQGVVYGTVYRFLAREGGPRGASKPAAVSFDLEMRHVDGPLLWKGAYDEVQKSLSEDPGSFSRARARGFSFVNAEALAQYGAVELVRQMPGSGGAWK